MAARIIGPGSSFSGVQGSSRITCPVVFTDNSGNRVIQLDEMDNPYSVLCEFQQDLSSGANTITPPITGKAGGVVIIPPSTNTQSITLKGISGDTGIGMAPNGWALIPFPQTAPTTFVVTAGAAITGVRFIYF